MERIEEGSKIDLIRGEYPSSGEGKSPASDGNKIDDGEDRQGGDRRVTWPIDNHKWKILRKSMIKLVEELMTCTFVTYRKKPVINSQFWNTTFETTLNTKHTVCSNVQKNAGNRTPFRSQATLELPFHFETWLHNTVVNSKTCEQYRHANIKLTEYFDLNDVQHHSFVPKFSFVFSLLLFLLFQPVVPNNWRRCISQLEYRSW